MRDSIEAVVLEAERGAVVEGVEEEGGAVDVEGESEQGAIRNNERYQ